MQTPSHENGSTKENDGLLGLLGMSDEKTSKKEADANLYLGMEDS